MLDNMFWFAKDKQGRYTGCSPRFAAAVGSGSVADLLGKTDYDVVWREQGDHLRGFDQQVMLVGQTREHAEWVLLQDGWRKVMFTRSATGEGVEGFFVDITDVDRLGYWTRRIDRERQRLHLGNDFADDYLTAREYMLLVRVILGEDRRQISESLMISVKTVDAVLQNLKRKLRCSSTRQITATAADSGIIYLALENQDWFGMA